MLNNSAAYSNSSHDLLFIGGIKATIAAADPVWAVQALEMRLGARSPGYFEPPIPQVLIDNYLSGSTRI